MSLQLIADDSRRCEKSTVQTFGWRIRCSILDFDRMFCYSVARVLDRIVVRMSSLSSSDLLTLRETHRPSLTLTAANYLQFRRQLAFAPKVFPHFHASSLLKCWWKAALAMKKSEGHLLSLWLTLKEYLLTHWLTLRDWI